MDKEENGYWCFLMTDRRIRIIPKRMLPGSLLICCNILIGHRRQILSVLRNTISCSDGDKTKGRKQQKKLQSSPGQMDVTADASRFPFALISHCTWL